MKGNNGLLTTAQAAQRLGLHTWQLLYDVRMDKIRPDRTLGAAPHAGYLFRRSVVDAYRRRSAKAGRRTRPLAFGPDMLSLADVACALGIDRLKVESLVRRGALRVDGKASGVRYVLRRTLEDYQKGRANSG